MFSSDVIMCEASATDRYSIYPNPANDVLYWLIVKKNQVDDESKRVIDINSKIIQLQ